MLYILKDWNKSNITILKSITDNYLFDYTSDSIFQNTHKDIYPTIKELSRIISYEYLLSSDIHNYLQLSPFFNLLVELFNNTISKSLNTTKEPDNKRVGVIFGVYDIVIEGIYRLFSYNGYEKEMNNKKLKFSLLRIGGNLVCFILILIFIIRDMYNPLLLGGMMYLVLGLIVFLYLIIVKNSSSSIESDSLSESDSEEIASELHNMTTQAKKTSISPLNFWGVPSAANLICCGLNLWLPFPL